MSPKRIATDHPEIWLYSNGIYYARVWLNGRWHEYSLGTDNFNSAKAEYKTLLRRLNPEGSKDGVRVTDVSDAFINDKKKLVKNGNRRSRTLEEYEQKWEKHLFPFFKYKKLTEITTEVWEEYTETKNGMQLTHHRKIFGNFLRWCMGKRYINGIPDLPVPKYKVDHGKAISEDNLSALFKNCKTLKLTLFCSLYLYCAMRSREITALDWDRVHMDKMAIYIGEDHSKTKEERWIPFNQVVFDLFEARKEELISKYGKLPKWVFPMRSRPTKPMTDTGIYRSFNTAKKNAKIDQSISPHDFRHTWTTEARNNPNNSDANMEKFAGSSTLVQKGTYHHPTVEKLRPLAETINSPELNKVISSQLNLQGKPRGKGKST